MSVVQKAGLWTRDEAAAAIGALLPDSEAGTGWTATGVSIDTRTLQRGDLFIALVGPNLNGHRFVGKARENGAAAAIVAEDISEAETGALPLLRVGETLAGLTALGAAARARSRAVIIGVTGSVGKTGTKEALRRALEPQGRVAASAGSLNNHWGVPLTLARMPRDAEFGVVEMGMNHAGELAALTCITRPDIAVITTVEAVHLENFPSVEAIADAKAEIFLGMAPGGVAILSRDNPYFGRLAAAARACGITRIIGFGTDEQAEARLLDYAIGPESSRVTACIGGVTIRYSLGQPGRHWVMNSLAVLAAVQAAGADIGLAAQALEGLAAPAGRGIRHCVPCPGGAFTLIDESYNASPVSMHAAISVLGAADLPPGGRRIAILGSMLELGDRSAEFHAALARPLAEAGIDRVFTVGSEMEALRDALPGALRGGHCATAAEMAGRIAPLLRPGDLVCIKGSHGSRMTDIVTFLLSNTDAPLARTTAG
jgi:UDP-N-acetylmuramoyl-tripeptide--D-alanyl-D-alanine ligase